MKGAIVGDIIGSRWEFNNTFRYDFELFSEHNAFTDDTICTIAIADAIINKGSYRDYLLKWCRKYPNPKGAYGGSFGRWIISPHPQPYNSFGNGAAMRISPVGFAFDTEMALIESDKATGCTHNHSEGLKGASSIASCIRCILNGGSKGHVNRILCEDYGTDYETRIPKRGMFDETCQGTVPLSIHLFLESNDFEDAIRKAVSYGGDSDTVGAIVGGLAEAFYGVPEWIWQKAESYLPEEMKSVISKFYKEAVLDRRLPVI
ncbi:MAG: ADP-ribosylglycohydrolase family protein [Paludibacteraceae bacterium]|nr:ADP-ribosylglycohydrolase family protein [Paludibacteraceae bacterium]